MNARKIIKPKKTDLGFFLNERFFLQKTGNDGNGRRQYLDGRAPAAPGGGDVNTIFGGVYKDADKFNSLMKLVFISVGEAEKTNPVRETYRILKDHGIKNLVFYESPKTDHEWLTWRRSLREFAPLLFK